MQSDAWMNAVRSADDPGHAPVVGARAASQSTWMFSVNHDHRAFLQNLFLHLKWLGQIGAAADGERPAGHIPLHIGVAVRLDIKYRSRRVTRQVEGIAVVSARSADVPLSVRGDEFHS